MRHRIRVIGILRQEDQILLVDQRVSPDFSRWSPPGGGMEPEDSDIYAGAVREVYEETGLHVTPGSLRYVSEFVFSQSELLMLELWIDCFPKNGEGFGIPRLGHTAESDGLLDVAWWKKDALLEQPSVNVPLRNPVFWENLDHPDPGVLHLGRWEE